MFTKIILISIHTCDDVKPYLPHGIIGCLEPNDISWRDGNVS